MEQSVRTIFKSRIHADDGNSGKVNDIVIDTLRWKVEAFVIELLSFKTPLVVLHPENVTGFDPESRTMSVGLVKKEVEALPSAETIRTVTDIHNHDIHTHHQWPFYWRNESRPPHPQEISKILDSEEEDLKSMLHNDMRDGMAPLRACSELIGYTVRNYVEKQGRVDDFLLDSSLQNVTDLVASLKHRKTVRFPVDHIKEIRWFEKSVYIDPYRYDFLNP